MDKFAFWTLKVLSYVFIASAAASLILWIAEDDSYSHPATSWIVWVSAILTPFSSPPQAMRSHVLSKESTPQAIRKNQPSKKRRNNKSAPSGNIHLNQTN